MYVILLTGPGYTVCGTELSIATRRWLLVNSIRQSMLIVVPERVLQPQ